MARSRLTPGQSVSLVLALMVLVGLAVTILGGAVFVPQAGVFVVLTAAAAIFLAVQVWVFRAAGLRSEADEPTDEDDDTDWRAWRG